MNLKQSWLIVLALILALGAVWTVAPGSILAAAQHDAAADQHPSGEHRRDRHQAHGDKPVVAGLVKATADATGQRPRAVLAALEDGKSIAQIAQAANVSTADLLVGFDRLIDQGLARAVASGRLPQSVADARAAWFKQSARLQIEQPGLTPRFPGLHEVHVVMISAAVKVSGLSRAEIREQLESCKTLADIVAAEGKRGSDVSDTAMAAFDQLLQRAVDTGKLTAARRDAWRAALVTATSTMTTTPGLHVAGKQCAP